MLILGIDDAGRGPVIGPMVMAGVLIDSKDEDKLRLLGVKDSKQVIQSKREILAKEIEKIAVSYHFVIISANEIDGRGDAGLNLNQLEAVKTAAIINKLNKKDEKIKVVIDCPSVNTKSWQHYLEGYIDNIENLSLYVEHKADINHVACSAGSIIAKVTREKEIEKLKKKIGVDFGSGYPSDPITKEFIAKHGEQYLKEGIIRQTWATWTLNHEPKKEKKQKSLSEF
ncbi:MAG: ribonuclease HII [archaeon]